MKLSIRDKTFEVAVSDSDETRFKGLSGLEKLGNNKGMLFIFEEPIKIKMVMRDMKFPLDFIFIDQDWSINQLDSLEANDTLGVNSAKSTQMVLEVNKGVIKDLQLKVGMTIKPSEELNIHKAGVIKFKKGGVFQKIGDVVYEVKEDDIKIDHTKVQVLNDKGEVATNIDGGARIFSREHTKEIIENAKGKKTKELGKLMVNILDKHNSQEQDFVST